MSSTLPPRAIHSHLRDRGIIAVIPEPDDQKGHRIRRGSRGGRPVTYDSEDYRGRNVIERRFAHLKQWRGLATRYDKHATVYRAAVVLHAVIAWTRHLSDTLAAGDPWSARAVQTEAELTRQTAAILEAHDRAAARDQDWQERMDSLLERRPGTPLAWAQWQAAHRALMEERYPTRQSRAV